MLTSMVTQDMIDEWKHIFKDYHLSMTPNRKTGVEVDQYFTSKYPYQIFDSLEFKKIVELNITENEHSYHKIRDGEKPCIHTYKVGEVIIGIDISSGEYHIECEDIEKVVPIYDDLFLYRGLDEDDLKNYFMVAQYVKISQSIKEE